jgi:hypothetical protein
MQASRVLRMGGDQARQQVACIRPAAELAVDVRVPDEEDDLVGPAETDRAGEEDQQACLPPGLSLLQIDDDDLVGGGLSQGIEDLCGRAVGDRQALNADVRRNRNADRPLLLATGKIDLEVSVLDIDPAVDDSVEERKRDRQEAQQQDADEHHGLGLRTRPVEKPMQDLDGDQEPDQQARGRGECPSRPTGPEFSIGVAHAQDCSSWP